MIEILLKNIYIYFIYHRINNFSVFKPSNLILKIDMRHLREASIEARSEWKVRVDTLKGFFTRS